MPKLQRASRISRLESFIGRKRMSREDTEIVASQLAELTRAVEKLTAELETVRARADNAQDRADTQQERIDLAARAGSGQRAPPNAVADALRESI